MDFSACTYFSSDNDSCDDRINITYEFIEISEWIFFKLNI